MTGDMQDSTADFVSSKGRYSSAALATVKVLADRWSPVVALIVASIALTVVILDREQRDERFERSVREADARWLQALNENTSRWIATHHQLDTKWQDSQRKADIQWQESYRRSDAQWAQAYKELERENRLAQKGLDDMRVEMLRVGLNPNPHMTGESR